jgi:hypothetical protein
LALSSGTVLNAIDVLGAALCKVLRIVSNNKRFLGGRRTPAPMTTQSYVLALSRCSKAGPAVASGWIRHRSACQTRWCVSRAAGSLGRPRLIKTKRPRLTHGGGRTCGRRSVDPRSPKALAWPLVSPALGGWVTDKRKIESLTRARAMRGIGSDTWMRYPNGANRAAPIVATILLPNSAVLPGKSRNGLGRTSEIL